MNSVISLGENDGPNKINLDELYDKKKNKDLQTLNLFNRILNRIHTRIKLISKQSKEQCCWFILPETILGVPKFDFNSCNSYVINQLIENGFNVTYTHPNLLLIAWASWCPTYVRNEIKKKTGISIDSSGKKIEEEEKQLTIKESMLKTKLDKIDKIDKDVKPSKVYTNIDDYKPSGNIYNENILRKIHERKS